MKTSHLVHVIVLASALSIPSFALAGSKTYQVTGKVLEVTDKMIAVEKGKDRWEIDRDADTKVEENSPPSVDSAGPQSAQLLLQLLRMPPQPLAFPDLLIIHAPYHRLAGRAGASESGV